MDLSHLQFKSPFTCMVCGPTSSGKTVLTRAIIKDFQILMQVNDPIYKVMWCYGIWQPFYNVPIAYNVEVNYVSGLPSEEEIDSNMPHLIVLDDLMNELGGNPKLADLFTKGSHHKNISVLFITQNMFHKGSQMRNVALNCHYYIIMKNPRDKAQIEHFSRQAFPGKSKYFLEAYDDATKEPHGYLKVDLTQSTPDQYRVQTRIATDQPYFSPIIYMPK